MAKSKRQASNRLVPLDEAAWRFASSSAKAEFDRARSLPWPDVPIAEPRDQIDAIKKASERIGATLDHATARSRPIWDMRDRLIKQLKDGKFEAFGVKTKPEIGLEPRKIPEFIFDSPKVRWGARTVENFGQKFEGVSVRRKIAEVAVETPGTAKPAPTGRPSKAAEIEKAISMLLDCGEKLNNIPRGTAYDAIRKFAQKELNANTQRGYSNPVIQRCLVRIIGKRI